MDADYRTELARHRTEAAESVRLAGIGTALPPHRLVQSEIAPQLEQMFAGSGTSSAALRRIIDNAGVETRWSVCSPEWFERPRSWRERTNCFLESATDLFVAAAAAALADARWPASTIDTVVTVSSTGIATPTLEARGAQRLGMRADVRRVPVFGLGCAGGVSGLAIAKRLAHADPGSRVLMVCVETCTLSFRTDRGAKADLVAAALFGDGAAALCVSSRADVASSAPVLGDGLEHLWPDTLDVMGWDVDDSGFGVVFDRSIPPFVDTQLRAVVDSGLAQTGLTRDQIGRFVSHPGGPKVVAAIENALELPAGVLDHERAVLREHGNMSAPTVLFVLERVLAAATTGTLVLTALGPGFTAAMLPLRFED